MTVRNCDIGPAFFSNTEKFHPVRGAEERTTKFFVARLALVATIFFTCHAQAQQWPFEYWHEGKLVLEAGDTLKGKIKYDIQTDIIQFDQKGALQSFTGRKIVFYEIFDVTSSRYRQFYSIPYSPTGGYKAPVFFELLSEGKITLLAREALENKTYNTGYYGYGSISRIVLVNKYFTLNDKGVVEPFAGTKKDLLQLMEKKEDEVKRFMKVNRLDLDRKYDLARVFDYYNSLFKKK
jgi:hypothetical protein